MTNPPNPRRARTAGRIPDRLVDAYFDHALDEGKRERLYRAMLADPRQAELMARMQRAIGTLREPVQAPDLTDAIMARVHARRRFLPARLRHVVTTGRLAIAASLLVGFAGIALLQRYAPRAVELAPRERPLTAVIDAGKADASSGARDLAGALSAVTASAGRVIHLQNQVLEHVRVARTDLGAPLTPGQLAGVRTLPPANRQNPQIIVWGGSGTPSAADAPDLVPGQFAASRFPLAGMVASMGGQWVWPGGPGAESCDRLFVIPGAAPRSAGLDMPVETDAELRAAVPPIR